MKAFVIISFLAVNALAARLDNGYIPPPPNAHSAGGFNLDTPKQALPSNIQSQYTAPGGQTQYQQQQISRPGLNQGTFTSQSHGNGFQSVSAGSFSNTGNAPHAGFAQPQSFQAAARPAFQAQQQPSYQAPQQNYQPQQKQTYQPSYQPQPQYNNYQQSGYNQASTTPIPILKCEFYCVN